MRNLYTIHGIEWISVEDSTWRTSHFHRMRTQVYGKQKFWAETQ